MNHDPRARLKMLFKDLEVGNKFQMVNKIMGAAMVNSMIMTKVNEFEASIGNVTFCIRPDWEVEII